MGINLDGSGARMGHGSHVVNQVRIANSAMVELMMHGEISQGVRDIAREFGISDARLGAMVLFLQTKGPPRQ